MTVGSSLRAALSDSNAVSASVQRNTTDRHDFNRVIARALKPIDFHGNFVMINTDRPQNR